MQGHPHPERGGQFPPFPRLGSEVKLGGKRGLERVVCGGEGSAEGIADGLENIALMRFNALAHQGIVACKGGLHSVGVLLPKPCAALDVGEEKSYGSCGKNGHCTVSNARLDEGRG